MPGGAPITVSVVVPVYNSEKSLAELCSRLAAVLPEIAEKYEVVLVNDGSRDKSWDVIQSLCARRRWVRGINLMRNYGQHNALLCGIKASRYEYVVTLDDDLQNPPEEIPRLLEKLAEGYDVVYGTPQHEQHGLFRNLASRATKIAMKNTLGAEIAQNISAFRAFRSSLRSVFEEYRGAFVSIDVLLTWGTTRFAAVKVRHEPRTIGHSHYTFWKLMTHTMNMMTGFSTVPLQVASITGIVFAIFGVGILIFVLGRYFIQGTSVPGFPFLASVIAIFSGAQLFALGIMGEYMARMHFRTMDRPAYVVRAETEELAASPQLVKAGAMSHGE
jgi:glycosyltransferase involved in cell wall biosynthesis